MKLFVILIFFMGFSVLQDTTKKKCPPLQQMKPASKSEIQKQTMQLDIILNKIDSTKADTSIIKKLNIKQ